MYLKYQHFHLDWILVAEKKECGGSEVAVGPKATLSECAKSCRGNSSMFIYGTNDFTAPRCNINGEEGCMCYCETSSTTRGCNEVRNNGFRLYKYVDLGND